MQLSLPVHPSVPYGLITQKRKCKKIKIGINVPRCTSIEKVKGQGNQMSKTTRNCHMSSVHVYLWTGALAAQAPTAN